MNTSTANDLFPETFSSPGRQDASDEPISFLMPIRDMQVCQAQVPTVNARELHAFLEVKSHFRNWIRNRIEDFDFVENQDFILVAENLATKGRGGDRRSKDYYLTLDMAKELSMVERNTKGKQARQYFIDCERRAKQQALSASALLAPFNVPNTLPEALRLAADLADKNIVLEHRVAEQRPKVEALERIASADGSLCMRDSAKVLQIRPVDLKNWLLINRWIYGRPGHSGWLGYQDKIQSGLLCHKVHTKIEADGNERTFEQVRITSRGLTRIGESLSRLAA